MYDTKEESLNVINDEKENKSNKNIFFMNTQLFNFEIDDLESVHNSFIQNIMKGI